MNLSQNMTTTFHLKMVQKMPMKLFLKTVKQTADESVTQDAYYFVTEDQRKNMLKHVLETQKKNLLESLLFCRNNDSSKRLSYFL